MFVVSVSRKMNKMMKLFVQSKKKIVEVCACVCMIDLNAYDIAFCIVT